MKGKRRAGAAMLLSVAGCAEHSTVYHNRSTGFPKARAITVDSYQRSTVFSQPPGNDEELRVCAEAAPDTFAALSASLAAKVDVKTQAGQLAAAMSQTGATIERTQTINLLRESMYRTCERYLSGAISKATLVVQAARDQRTMLSVLAIEQLTRTIRPPATVISAPATSASVPSEEAIKLATAAREDRDDARAASIKADTAFDDAKGGKCVGTTAAPEGAATDVVEAWSKCKLAEEKATQAKAALDKEETRFDQVLALGGGGGAIESSTAVGPNNAGGGGAVASPEAIEAVAKAVQSIANAPSLNEALMFCIGYLGKKAKASEVATVEVRPEVVEDCRQIIKARAIEETLSVENFFWKAPPGAVSTGSRTLLPDPASSGRRLRSYLRDPASSAERKRRMALAQRASVSVGFSPLAADVYNIVLTGNDNQRQALLDALSSLETNAAGKAALSGT